MSERTKILITVKTYPHPSQRYRETVCTAGVTESGEWIRLYPIPFRYLPRVSRFGKYQWISVELGDKAASNDPRPESRRPKLDTLQLLGEPLGPQKNWAFRRDLIDPMPHHTIKQLRQLYRTSHTSLGIVRPTEVLDLVCKP